MKVLALFSEIVKNRALILPQVTLSNVLECNQKNTLPSFFDCSDGLGS